MAKREIEKKAHSLFKEYDKEYSGYVNKSHALLADYEKELSETNSVIDRINVTREDIRHPLKMLYEFLSSIGNNIDVLSIFDFRDEEHYRATPFEDIRKSQKPVLEKTYFPFEPYAMTMQKNGRNSKALSEFEAQVSRDKLKFGKDIQDKKDAISAVKTAHDIAELYKNTIIAIKDTIDDNIIPEFNYILAFLYADDIREKILENTALKDIHPHNIVEYKGTLYNDHYIFVQNTHAFYLELSKFFSSKVLTDLLSNKVVRDEDLSSFREQVNAIRSSISKIKDGKVAL